LSFFYFSPPVAPLLHSRTFRALCSVEVPVGIVFSVPPCQLFNNPFFPADDPAAFWHAPTHQTFEASMKGLFFFRFSCPFTCSTPVPAHKDNFVSKSLPLDLSQNTSQLCLAAVSSHYPPSRCCSLLFFHFRARGFFPKTLFDSLRRWPPL